MSFSSDRGSPGVSITGLDALDITASLQGPFQSNPRVAESASLGGLAEDMSTLLDRRLALACVLTVAESVGASGSGLRDGAAIRQRPHRFRTADRLVPGGETLLADTSLVLGMSKAAGVAAATNVGVDDGYGLEAASIAKAFVGDCGIDHFSPELLPGVRGYAGTPGSTINTCTCGA